MANVKISTLPAGTALVDTDTLPVVRAGVTTAVNTGTLIATVASQGTSITALQNSVQTHTALDQSTWTWINQGDATITQQNRCVRLVITTAGAGENFRIRKTTAPVTTPYTFTVLMGPGPMYSNSIFGFGFRESSTGKVCIVGLNLAAGAGTASSIIRKMTNPTTLASQAIDTINANSGTVWLRINHDGTNLTYSYSFNGLIYITLLTETKGTFFTAGPDEICIAGCSFTNSGAAAEYLSFVQS